MIKMKQCRWKSKIVWTTITALLVMVGGNLGLWDAIGVTGESFQTAVDLVLSALVAVGILNNPTDCENF